MTDTTYTQPDLTLLGAEHVRRYQETDGEVGYIWNGVPTLLLTTTGRSSGEPRTTPLIFARDGADYLVVASMGGAPAHPQWYGNLQARPEARIQVRGEQFVVTARTATDDEKARLWAIVSEQWPNYDLYQSRTERIIPIVVLTPVTTQAQRIRQLAQERPAEPAYVQVRMDGAEEVATYADLDRRASQLAGALADRGVGYGDRLGLGLRNSRQFVFAAFAAWKLGAVPVPVRWDLPDWELDRLREVIRPRVYLGPDDVPWIDSTTDREAPVLPDVLAPHLQGICSSGSTGTPKIIVAGVPAVFHPVFSTPMAENWMPVPRPQTNLVLAPMYHVNAFSALHTLLAGDRVVVMEKFDAALALELIEKHHVTTFTATPTMLQRMADAPGVHVRDLSSLVWIQQGAAPMPPSLVHRWAELIGPERIVMAYGMTESIGITALRGDEWMRHEGSVGRGMRGTEVKILDLDGNELAPGEIGEIYMRSPSYGGSSYLGAAPQLRETHDGFRTVGDMGHVDEDGYLYIADRRVDLIITGGANVFPAEVEKALIDHPKIADIVVIGLRDPEWGRRVHALIEPADPEAPPTSEEIIGYAKSRLAPYKVPKTIELVDVMPRSAATKINRARLVEARGG